MAVKIGHHHLYDKVISLCYQPIRLYLNFLGGKEPLWMTIFIGIIVGRKRRQGKRLKKALPKKTACKKAGCKGGREGGKRAREEGEKSPERRTRACGVSSTCGESTVEGQGPGGCQKQEWKTNQGTGGRGEGTKEKGEGST